MQHYSMSTVQKSNKPPYPPHRKSMSWYKHWMHTFFHMLQTDINYKFMTVQLSAPFMCTIYTSQLHNLEQQSSFNPASSNRADEESSPKIRSFAFYQEKKKSFINATGTYQAFKEFLHIKQCGISWPLVSYSINFLSYEDFRKDTRGP
jgi:hypothetical protein